jgi:hypothetical protein
MAASNPIRIDKELFEQAAAEADWQKRSIPKQVEYWAELGQICDGLITHADAIRLREGLLKIEPDDTTPIDADEVFADLDAARESRSLKNLITQAKTIYQASEQHAGYLEQIDTGGNVLVGQFKNGKFQPKD